MVSKKINKIVNFIDNIYLPGWLIAVLVMVFILRIPSFFEPYSYGDEMIYLTLGQGIKQGIPLYKGIYDNKPPLLYIIAAISGSLFWFKIILASVNLISICLFWKLSKILFPKNKSLIKVATIIFGILTTIPLLEGNIANAELFMLAPTIGALIIIFSKKQNFKNLFFAGTLFSLATLFKIPAAFDLPAIVTFWLIYSITQKGKFINFLKKTFYLVLGFLTPVFLSLIWFFLQGSLKDYVFAAFIQNIGYLSSWRPDDVQEPFITRNLPLIIRGVVLVTSCLLIFLKRKKLSKNFIFITLWLLFSLFAVTLSERPYPHYLIQSVPAISLLLAILFTQESIEQSLAIIPLALAFFVPVFYNYYHYPTLPYYLRFAKYSLGLINKKDYG